MLTLICQIEFVGTFAQDRWVVSTCRRVSADRYSESLSRLLTEEQCQTVQHNTPIKRDIQWNVEIRSDEQFSSQFSAYRFIPRDNIFIESNLTLKGNYIIDSRENLKWLIGIKQDAWWWHDHQFQRFPYRWSISTDIRSTDSVSIHTITFSNPKKDRQDRHRQIYMPGHNPRPRTSNFLRPARVSLKIISERSEIGHIRDRYTTRWISYESFC
jgi:hypothetical protein